MSPCGVAGERRDGAYSYHMLGAVGRGIENCEREALRDFPRKGAKAQS